MHECRVGVRSFSVKLVHVIQWVVQDVDSGEG